MKSWIDVFSPNDGVRDIVFFFLQIHVKDVAVAQQLVLLTSYGLFLFPAHMTNIVNIMP